MKINVALEAVDKYKDMPRGLKHRFDFLDGELLRVCRLSEFPVVYSINKKNNVFKQDIFDCGDVPKKIGTVSCLQEDDYEFYSDNVCFDTGYLKFKTKTEDDVIDVLVNFRDFLQNKAESENLELKAGFQRDRVTYVSYEMDNGITVSLRTVRSVCRENNIRNSISARCFPFIKNLDNNEVLYVAFSLPSSVYFGTEKDKLGLEDAIEGLTRLLEESGNSALYIKCRTNLPVFI